MWTKITHIVFKYRLYFILSVALITAFMGYKARDIEWSYDFGKAVPSTDPDMIYYKAFKERFGEDGNIFAIGVKDSSLYNPQNFRRFSYLSDEIKSLNGVTSVISLPSLQKLVKDSKNKKFNLMPFFESIPEEQQELDSMLNQLLNLKFYSGQIINQENGATLILVTIQKDILNSSKRDVLITDVIHACEMFSEVTGIELHYAGLPFVRSVGTLQLARELQMFLIFSVLITGFILFLFFRSAKAVVFPLIIIGVVVVWIMGSLALLGYKITLLTGLLPPIIVVIGIPNSVYLLNKYHQEYENHGNKMLALSQVVKKIGLATLITNSTTAIGFGVLSFIDIVILREFGIVASLNIMATFVVSIILIPAVFSYLPPPNTRHLRHLQFKPLGKILSGFDHIVRYHKLAIFSITGLVVGVSIYGLSHLYSVSFMVDDLPEDSKIIRDLHFFETHFSGVMPLEVVVDTGKRRGILKLNNLKKVDELEQFLAEQKHISKPISIVSFVKAIRQAFYNDNPDRYDLPTKQDKNFIFRYLSKSNQDSSNLLNTFVDSNSQVMRVSLKVADIGSIRMDSLVTHVVKPKIAEIFGDTDIDVTITGTTLLFIKGNRFLIQSLRNSFILAFILIALIMALLFNNKKMIILSLIPNVIPLLMTAGLMGFLDIPLKPSTAIIFSIAFGISVDYSIHLLAKYRMELYASNFSVPVAVSKSILEIGPSMIYTCIILFAGFVIFSYSEFGGTKALGMLTSTTLLVALFTNLLLLPALLLTFDSGKRKKGDHPLIEQFDEFYYEQDDEDIDLKQIKIKENDQGPGNILEKRG